MGFTSAVVLPLLGKQRRTRSARPRAHFCHDMLRSTTFLARMESFLALFGALSVNMSHERRRLIYSAVSFAVTSTISARSGVSLYAVVMDEMAASGGFFLPSVCICLSRSACRPLSTSC